MQGPWENLLLAGDDSSFTAVNLGRARTTEHGPSYKYRMEKTFLLKCTFYLTVFLICLKLQKETGAFKTKSAGIRDLS